MNDRFRFRVWDKENKCLHYPTRYNNFSIVNGTVVKIESYPTANSAYLGKRIAYEFDDAVIMQCTGLKDKNGKLIYEGDIVKIKNEIFFIKYEIGSFLIIRNQQSLDAWYEMFTEAWNDDVYPLSQLYVDEYIQEEYIDCIEVIGNIYENESLFESEG